MAHESDLRVLPPPTAAETYGATKTRRKVVDNGHAKRQTKGLVQFNVKIRARVRERFEEAAATSGITKGELLERMILQALEGISPSAPDEREGRTERLDVYAVPVLAETLRKRAAAREWTLSETVEHACAVAKTVQDSAMRDGVDLDTWLDTARAVKPQK